MIAITMTTGTEESSPDPRPKPYCRPRVVTRRTRNTWHGRCEPDGSPAAKMRPCPPGRRGGRGRLTSMRLLGPGSVILDLPRPPRPQGRRRRMPWADYARRPELTIGRVATRHVVDGRPGAGSR